jgi:hypothetical protein
MGSRTRKIAKTLSNHGIDVNKFLTTTFGWRQEWFHNDLAELKRQMGDDRSFQIGPFYKVPKNTGSAGEARSVYFLQDLYVARKVFEANPTRHVDIGSLIGGFVAHVASFREIEVFDIRPLEQQIRNMVFRQADLMQVPSGFIDYCDSLSSLHAIEHFGLGRYGDPIDYFGHVKAIDSVSQILKKNGVFYFSVPIGFPQRIEFNGHRVFGIDYLLQILSKHFDISSFTYINDKRDLIEDVRIDDESARTSFGCRLGCGIFTCVKK